MYYVHITYIIHVRMYVSKGPACAQLLNTALLIPEDKVGEGLDVSIDICIQCPCLPLPPVALPRQGAGGCGKVGGGLERRTSTRAARHTEPRHSKWPSHGLFGLLRGGLDAHVDTCGAKWRDSVCSASHVSEVHAAQSLKRACVRRDIVHMMQTYYPHCAHGVDILYDI